MRARLAGRTYPAGKDPGQRAAGRIPGTPDAAVENYPKLEGSKKYGDLLEALKSAEYQIAVARRKYNEAVEHYNARIELFPEQHRGFADAPRQDRRIFPNTRNLTSS